MASGSRPSWWGPSGEKMKTKTMIVAALFVATLGMSAIPGAEAAVLARSFVDHQMTVDFGDGAGVYSVSDDEGCAALLGTGGLVGTGGVVGYYYSNLRVALGFGEDVSSADPAHSQPLAGNDGLEDCFEDEFVAVFNEVNGLFGDPPEAADPSNNGQAVAVDGFEAHVGSALGLSFVMEDASQYSPDLGSVSWSFRYCVAAVANNSSPLGFGDSLQCSGSSQDSDSDYGASASLGGDVDCASAWNYGGALNPTVNRDEGDVWAHEVADACHGNYDHLDNQPAAPAFFVLSCGSMNVFDLLNGGASSSVYDNAWHYQVNDAASGAAAGAAYASNPELWDGLYGHDELAALGAAHNGCA